ncbi:MAG: SdiA-regulated domain-containing protein [Bacteroidota bacterium]
MKSIFKISLISILCLGGFSIIAGNVLSVDPPVAISSKFKELYPTASLVQWEMEKENYEAEFMVEGREIEVLFSPTGILLSEDKEVKVSEIPAPVMRSFNKDFSGFKITQAFLLWSNEHVQYKLIASSLKDRVHIWMDNSGAIESKKVFAREKKALVKSGAIKGFSAIDSKWELPDVLREVSGVAMHKNNIVACVQDEQGTVFLYDLTKKKIVDSFNFGGPGDYEGISIVNNDIYILRSDGQLTCVSNFESEQKISTYFLKLPQGFQNFEGLCYDRHKNRLLIAPRFFDSADRTTKNIYSFDITTKKFSATPVYSIKLSDKIFNSVVTKKEALIPSEIFVHPVSGKIYLTDARNKYILISDPGGSPLKLLPLDPLLFAKTEGITMDADGMFYLSNEGKTGPATLIKISPENFD